MINNFLSKSEEEQISIIVDVLKKDYVHKFIDNKTHTVKDIAESTLKVIQMYGYFNENNPIGITGYSDIKICFQPSKKGKYKLDRVIVYFAHMITVDNHDLKRIYSITKNKAIYYMMMVLQSPSKMFIQNKKNSFLFEKRIPLNNKRENCQAVLYVEDMGKGMLRVVTILPDVKENKMNKQKEDNTITEISSFLQLRNSISPSSTGEFGNGGELLSNLDSTNIQNKFIECTPEDEIILKLTENQQDNFLNPNKMSQETLEKIEKLEKAINSPVTPDAVKVTMRKVLETLKSEKVEVTEPSLDTEAKTITKYTDIKSCLLDDGDDNDDYIYEGKHIHNVETSPKDTWEIVEFYNNGVVLKHVPTSVLADNKPDKNVSFSELKTLFVVGKIEIDGIENGNTKVFNLCIKAIIKCISNIDEIANKKAVISELTSVKNDLEKNIEKANALENEKSELLNKNSDLEKTSTDKISSLESSISDEKSSFEKAKIMADLETANLKKKLEDLEALNVVRSVIDMLNDDVMKKDLKELHTSDILEPKVEQIFPKQEGLKYKSGDFVFAHIFKDENKRVPFIVSDFSNGKYYILGDGSHFVSEDKLSSATEKDFDEYYGDSADSFKVFEKGGTIGKVKNIDDNFGKTELPEEVYFKGKKYIGRASFINGFNGYTSSKDDGILCALTQEKGYDREKLSLWDDKSKPNYLTDKDGFKIMSKNYRGENISFEENGVRKFANGGSVGYGEIKKEKEKLTSELFEKCGLFFAFSNEQFEKNKTPLKEGEKYVSIGSGGYIPKGNYDTFKEGMKTISKIGKKKVKENNLAETEILYELNNHECFYTGDYSDVVDMFKGTYTEEEIRDVYNKNREKFENGGGVYNENAEMVLNNNKQIKHHIEELNKVVNSNTEVPAWVVAKVNRSSSDLSDATHYLEGVNSEFKNGGEINSILKQFNELTAVNNHDDAAILLAENYGTDEEVSKLKEIQRDTDKRGYVTRENQVERDAISNKYYYQLKNLNKIDGVSMSRLKGEFAKEPEIFSGSVVKRGSNEFKIDGDFFYMKTPDSDWEKFRKINFNIQ